MNPWLPGAYIRCHWSILDASAHILDARTDTVTMTRSRICMHAPQMAIDNVIVTILSFFLCMQTKTMYVPHSLIPRPPQAFNRVFGFKSGLLNPKTQLKTWGGYVSHSRIAVQIYCKCVWACVRVTTDKQNSRPKVIRQQFTRQHELLHSSRAAIYKTFAVAVNSNSSCLNSSTVAVSSDIFASFSSS